MLTLAAPKKKLLQKKPTGALTIEIVKGKELTEVGLLSCDPFVELVVEGDGKRTESAKNTVNPIWRQQFIFFIKNPAKVIIKLFVWHDGLLARTFMGKAECQLLPLLSLIHGATYKLSLKLEPRKQDGDKHYSGNIIIRLNYFGNIYST